MPLARADLGGARPDLGRGARAGRGRPRRHRARPRRRRPGSPRACAQVEAPARLRDRPRRRPGPPVVVRLGRRARRSRPAGDARALTRARAPRDRRRRVVLQRPARCTRTPRSHVVEIVDGELVVTPLGARGPAAPALGDAGSRRAWLDEPCPCGSDLPALELPGAPDGVSVLLSPIEVGSVEVRNRVAFTAHGSFLDFYRPGISGDRYVAYEERRAAGGAGADLPADRARPPLEPCARALPPTSPDDLAREARRRWRPRSTGTARRSSSSSIHFGGPVPLGRARRTSSRSGPSTTSSPARGRPPTG